MAVDGAVSGQADAAIREVAEHVRPGALRRLGPLPVPDHLDRGGDVPEQRERDPHPELGHGRGHRPGGVDDGDASAGGLVEVDPRQPVVERPRDHPEGSGAPETGLVERRELGVAEPEPRRHHDRVGLGQRCI